MLTGLQPDTTYYYKARGVHVWASAVLAWLWWCGHACIMPGCLTKESWLLAWWSVCCTVHLLRCASPHTAVCVQVVDGADNGAGTTSSVFSFTTPPAPGSSTSFVVLMAADIGQAQVDSSNTIIANKPGALGVRRSVVAWVGVVYVCSFSLRALSSRCIDAPWGCG